MIVSHWLGSLFGRRRQSRSRRVVSPEHWFRGPRIELLENRALLSFVGAVSGNNATFTGDGATDTLTLTATAGNLTHNRFGTDPGFNSAIDLDSTVPGDQSLLITTITNLTVTAGTGNDTIDVATALSLNGPLSLTGATITVNQAVTTPAGSGVTLNGRLLVSFAAAGSVTSGGVVTVAATAGSVTMANGAVIDAGSNPIDVDATGDITLGRLVTTNGTVSAITITSTGGGVLDGGDIGGENIQATDPNSRVTIDAATGVGVAGAFGRIETEIVQLDLSVTGAGSVDLADTNAIELLDVDTANGAITVTAGGLLAATDVNSSATDNNVNDITLTTTAGSIAVGNVVAGATNNDVRITSAATIAELPPGDATADITAHEIEFVAGTGIGNAAQIEIAVVNLAATTVSGDVSLRDIGGGVTIATVGATTGVSVTAGASGDDVVIRAASPLTVSSAVTNSGGGDISLAAEGSGTGDDLTINANITASGGNGNINLFAGDDVNHNLPATISAAGTGQVNVSAGENFNGGSNAGGNLTGDVVMADGVTIQSVSGDVTIEATGSVNVSLVTTAGNVTVSADDGDFGLANNSGSINDIRTGEGAGAENVIGDTVDLSAASGIGTGATLSGTGDLDTDASTLLATNTFSNTINIFEVDDVALSSVSNLTRAVVLDAGGLFDDGGAATLVTASTLTIRAVTGIGDGVGQAGTDIDTVVGTLAAQTDSGDINIDNVGALIIGAVGGLTGVTITDTLNNNSGSDDITVDADSPLTVSSAAVNNDGGDITLAAEDPSSSDDLTITAAITAVGGNGDISLYAGDDIIHTAGLISAAGSGQVRLSAGEDFDGGTSVAGNSSGDVTQTTGVTLQSGTGAISVEATGSISLSIVTTGGSVVVSADDNDFGLANDVGAITDVLAGEAANIIAASVILRAGSGSGSGTAPATTDIDTTVTTLAAFTETGNIHVQNSGALTIGSVTVTVAAVAETVNGATINDANAPNDTGSDITIYASSPLTVAQPVVNNDGGDITLAANGSAAADDLTINANVTATGGNGPINLYAGDTITVGPAATVSADGTGAVLLSASTNFNSGGALANGTNSAIIDMQDTAAVRSQDGTITVQAAGNVSLGQVDANSDNDAVLGNVVVTADFAGPAGGLSNSAGAIIDNSVAETANVRGGTATLRGPTGIGGAGAADIETDIVTLDALTAGTSGSIQINEVAAGIALDVTQARLTSASNPGVIVISTEDGDLNILVTGPGVSVAGSGTITLDANNSVANSAVHGDIDIRFPVTSVGGNITITADRDISGDADIISNNGQILMTADADGSSNGGNTDGTFENVDSDIMPGSGNVTLSLGDLDGNLNGTINGTGNVFKNGPGALRWNNAAYTYTGTTNINAGTLVIGTVLGVTTLDNPVLAGGDVIVNSGGVLGGNGTIADAARRRDVIVNAGGTLDPGSLLATPAPPGTGTPLPGQLTLEGDATIAAGGIFRVQLGGQTAGPAGYDQLVLFGVADISNATLVVSSSFTIPVGALFTIVANDMVERVSGSFAGLLEGSHFFVGARLLGITYIEDTNDNDVVLIGTGRFDFNGPANATHPMWEPVPEHTVKTPAIPAGWEFITPSFDRGGTDLLLRDGHFGGSTPNTFQVDVVATETYQVVVIIGDVQYSHDDDQVRVFDGGDPGCPNGVCPSLRTARVNTPVNGFEMLIFDNVTVGDLGGGMGRLFLEFRNIGLSDMCFVVNAIDVRPQDASAPILIQRQDGMPLTTAVQADGLTVDTYLGSLGPANATLTVTTTNGTIVSPDADPTLLGNQILTSAAGTFSFDILRPTSSIDGDIVVYEFSGTGFASATQAYDVADVRRFDFNSGSSPTATDPSPDPDFLSVLGTDLFTAEPGFGWTSQAGDADRGGSGFSDLRRDLHSGRDNTFQIEVLPGTNYNLRIYFGDPAFQHDNIELFVEAVSQFTIGVIAAGAFDIRTVLNVSSVNSTLDLRFVDNGGTDLLWAVVGVEIARSAVGLPGTFPLMADINDASLFGGEFALTETQLQPYLDEAVSRWRAAGVDESSLATLADVDIRIANQPGRTLSVADTIFNSITIDDDAAGWGWYLDPQPSDDREFLGASVGVRGMDLLTAIMHEFGHTLNFDDMDADADPNDLMVPSLRTGTRRSPDGLGPPIPVSASFDPAAGQIVVVAHEPSSIAISSAGGVAVIRVGGAVLSNFPAVRAAALRSIVVNGSSGNDAIDASGIGPTEFTNLSGVTLLGHAGNDNLISGAGRDLLLGGAGDDVLNGGSGDDSLLGDDGHDTLMGATGQDSLNGGAGHDLVRGQGTSLDSLTGGPGDDTLDGGAGTDVLVEIGDVDFVLTDARLTGLGSDTLVELTNERAFLGGGERNNRIDATGWRGNVTLNGSSGDDVLLGGANDDAFFGGSGRDWLVGGPGRDVLRGQGSSFDTLSGGSGDDTLDGGVGTDVLEESADTDFTLTFNRLIGLGTDKIYNTERARLTGGPSANVIDTSRFPGRTTLIGGAGNDKLTGTADHDMLDGEDGNDSLSSLAGIDSIWGGAGNDILLGGTGNDMLNAGDGSDVLMGEAGSDDLDGGAGEDTLAGRDADDAVRGTEHAIDAAFALDFEALIAAVS